MPNSSATPVVSGADAESPSPEQPAGDGGPSVQEVLHAAVSKLGGEERPGQIRMAEAVAHALRTRRHLLVQAGTGTGKSLGYLVPAVLHHSRVVVATATLALQHQLVERDIPALIDAVADRLGERPAYAVVKDRSNYACLHRVREGVPDDQGTLVDVPVSGTGSEVVKLRQWAEEQARSHGVGDRDSAPSHTERVWQQVSVNHRECLGAQKCPYGVECFAERARDRAARARLIVTNHSMLAIDAIDGVPMIPEYDVVVVDEAHELAARVTQAATQELSPAMVERAAKRARAFVSSEVVEDLAEAADGLRSAMEGTSAGRLDMLPDALAAALVRTQSAARAVFSAFPREPTESEAEAARQQARGMVDEVRKITERLARNADADVAWVAERERSRGGSLVCVAPLNVWGQLRERLLAAKTVVCTSATLKLGGDFTALAMTIGLRPSERLELSMVGEDSHSIVRGDGAQAVVESDRADCEPSAGDDATESEPSASQDAAQVERSADEGGPFAMPWSALDVGSPFDYPRQGILYVARHLAPPSRDGLSSAQISEIIKLVEAADGRTLGLFSSRRAAEVASEALREALPHFPVLCQGDGQLSHLQAEFVSNPAVSLFGTLSLWQGLDIPGATCQLVIIDRLPFPRPDDPLMSARARAADQAGVNGFMTVSATHAALLLAQGTGRLIRTRQDRGVVAVLDSRLATARYGGFIRSSLPPMWTTYDVEVVLAALRRIARAA